MLNASSQRRETLTASSSSGSSCVAVVLVRWFQERCLLAAVCPLAPSLSWHPSCPSFPLSIYPSLLETGPPSNWVNESKVPLKSTNAAVISCAARLYLGSGEMYCQGRSVGCLEDSYLSCGLFLCFSISDCIERILVAGLCTDLVRGTKTVKETKNTGKVG